MNDPTPFPPPSKSHGSYHWAFERMLSAGLVPLTVASFVTSGSNYAILDGILGVSLVMHSHIGVRPCLFPAFLTLLLPPQFHYELSRTHVPLSSSPSKRRSHPTPFPDFRLSTITCDYERPR